MYPHPLGPSSCPPRSRIPLSKVPFPYVRHRLPQLPLSRRALTFRDTQNPYWSPATDKPLTPLPLAAWVILVSPGNIQNVRLERILAASGIGPTPYLNGVETFGRRYRGVATVFPCIRFDDEVKLGQCIIFPAGADNSHW